MVFLFHEAAGSQQLKLRGEEFKYLIKVRRHKVDDTLAFRNPSDSTILYRYTITSITPRELYLELTNHYTETVTPKKSLHVGWCVIDPKSIEKTLPMLNEIGVTSISFIYCKRSQKNFKIDLKRLERILRSSMQQCGRSSFMEFSVYESLESFIQHYPDTVVFDFCDTPFDTTQNYETVLIGCEGGFSEDEKQMLQKQQKFRLDTPMVLRSESAVVAVASKLLL